VTNLGLFSVVVRHKVEDWRGVVVGWERSDGESAYGEEQTTSLTQKNYPLDPDDNVKYTILVDGNDAHLHYSKRRENHHVSAMTEFFQSDLEMVKDESLRRIRSSHISEFFKRFDSQTKSFVPNDILAYEFPADMYDYPQVQLSQKAEAASKDVISGTQEAANHLRSIILGYTSAPESRNMKVLSLFLDKLTALSEGDVVPVKDKLSDGHIPANKLAAMHLKQLLNLTVNVGDLLWQKRRTLENQKEIKFGLGDVVTHKVYGFRGVVVAWDPEPSFDVSRWDGLQHIKNPQEFPFYHIIPDQEDCIKVFGGERSSRYVCEENLDVCPFEQRQMDVDLEPEWEFNHADRVYIPPDDLKVRGAVYIPELCLLYISHFVQFKYGEDLEDDGMTERCLKEIRDALSHIFVSGRDGSSTSNPEIDSISKQMALNNLLELLKSAEDMEVASIVSESLKEIWKAHLDDQLRFKLDNAVAHLLAGNVSQALEDFSEVLDDDPSYAEAWNKASTCEFMMGNMDASLAKAQKTIECLPTHFQALNGLGLVYYEKKEISSAIDCFRKSMDLDPWSPVSARLSVCLETVKPQV
jgi:hemimethylated DNA binding protein